MITKCYEKDFDENHEAYTLSPDDIGMHDDGWIVTGAVIEDYYEWVNSFEAVHPVYGRVWGDFEDEVYADSEEGFAHFFENHTPYKWDYWDI